MNVRRSMVVIPGECSSSRGQLEGAVHDFDEAALLAQDEPLGLREREVLPGAGMGPETPAIGFIGSETRKRDEAPPDVVGPLVRQEIAYEVSPTFGNDAPPVARVLREGVALKRIDLIPDDARDHG